MGVEADDDDIGEVANPVGKIIDVDEDDSPPDAAMSSTTVGRRERKPLNKELFAKAAASVRKAMAEDGGVEGEDPADEILVTGPGAAAAPAGDPKPPDAAPPQPPAGPDPGVIAMFEQLNLRRADLDERERGLSERETRYRDVSEQFDTGSPLAALKGIVTYNLGDGATAEEIAEELSFMVTAMSLELAGATVDPSNTQHDLRKMKRELRQTKAEKRRNAAKEAEAAATQTKLARESQAMDAVFSEFEQLRAEAVKKDPNAFAWLSAAERPKDLLWQIIKREHDRSGNVLDIAEAARRADEHIKKETTGYFTKYKNLLQPAPVETPKVAERAPGGPPDRRSRPLSMIDASEESGGTPPGKEPERPLTKEERRARTIAKWKDKLKESDA